MQALNLPTYSFKIKSEKDRNYILDVIRRKYVALTPEEWVRQHFIHYLKEVKNYPLSLISVEAGFSLYNTSKRTDILVYNRLGNVVAMVECKAPEVKINNKVFEQIVRYNLSFKLKFIMVTNGMQHYCCALDHSNNTSVFLKYIPDFEELTFR